MLLALLMCWWAGDAAADAKRFLTTDDLPATPTMEQAQAFTVCFGRDPPSRALSEEIVAWFRQHPRYSFADVVRRLLADDEFLKEWDQLHRETLGRPMDTIALIRWPGMRRLDVAVPFYRETLREKPDEGRLVDLHGVVIDAEGKPVAGADVADLEQTRFDVTDRDGRFRLRTAATKRRLRPDSPLFEKLAVGAVAFVPGKGAAAVARAADADSNQPLELRLAAPRKGKMLIKGADGKPAANAQWWLSGSHEALDPVAIGGHIKSPGAAAIPSFFVFLRSDAQGTVDLSCLPAGIEVSNVAIEHPTHLPYFENDVLVPEVQLERGCVISGRIVGPDGKPVPLASIELRARNNSTSFVGSDTFTDGQGRFALRNTSAGDCRIFAIHRRLGPVHAMVKVTAEQPCVVELTMPAGRFVTGKFAATKGGVPADIAMYRVGGESAGALRPSDPFAYRFGARADADGSFRFGPLPPEGDVTIRVQSTERQNACRSFVAPAGKDDLGTIELDWPEAGAAK